MQLKVGWQDVEALNRFDNMLKVMGSDKMNLIMVRVLNQAGDTAYKGRGPSVVRTLAKQTGLTQPLIRRAVKPIKANFGHMEYRLVSYGGDISLKYFSPRELRSGVKAKVKNRQTVFKGTFMKGGRFPNRVEARGLNGHVFQRIGSGRLPIEKVKSGVVIPHEMISGATAAGWQQIVNDVLPRRMEHEINRATGGMFS